MEISIYSQEGILKVTASPDKGGQCVKELQGDSVLTLTFDYYEYVALEVNDYVDFCGSRYWLLEQYRPKEVSSCQWKYDVQFFGIESLIKRYLVIEHTDGAANPVFSLTAPARQHIEMIVTCLNRADGSGLWEVGDVVSTGNIVIDYTGKYCDEGLRELAEKTGAEYWFEGHTVNLCRCSYGDRLDIAYGNGLISLERDVAANAKFYTRLYPVGSSRNINPAIYGHARLQLPDGSRYVDLDVAKYGVIDHYEQEAFSGIFPRYTGTISAVRNEERTDDDGNSFTVYYFQDSGLPFDPNDYLLPGEKMRVSFQTGDLQGLGDTDDHYFEVDYNSDAGEFEIINIWTDGNQLPHGNLIPCIGDIYLPWNISMPASYNRLAEQEFRTAVDNYNANHFVDNSVYRGTTDHVWIEADPAVGKPEVEIYIGRPVRLNSSEFFPGTGYRDSRITKITRRLDLPSLMDLEISDAVSTMTLTKINDTLKSVMAYARGMEESVIYGGRLNRKNVWTAENVFRALVYLGRGLVFGTDGISGQGVEVDSDGNAAMTIGSIRVLKTLDVNEIVVNQIRHSGGLFVNSRANLIVSDIDEVDATHTKLFFKTTDGSGQKIWNLFEVGDLALSMTFNLQAQTGNIIRYYWREVTAVGEDYIILGLGVTNSDPVIGDNVVQIGHVSDRARQGVEAMGFSAQNGPYFAVYDGISAPTVPDFDNYARALVYLSPKRNKLTGTFVSETGVNLQEAISTMSGTIADIKRQADHQLVVWYGDYTPLPSNAPASEWTAAERESHINDIFYNQSASLASGRGRAWQWQDPHGDHHYVWSEITDSDTLAALEAAGLAQRTADSKARCFSTDANVLPEPPYAVGDLWLDATYTRNNKDYQGETLRCVTARDTGATPRIADWAPASSAVFSFIRNTGQLIAAGVAEAKQYADGAVDAVLALTDQTSELYRSVSSNTSGLRALNGTVSGLASRVGDAESYIGDVADALVSGLGVSSFSVVATKLSSIAAVTNKILFDSNNKITNISTNGLVTGENFATVFSQKITRNALGGILGISKSGIVTTDNAGVMYSEHKDGNGNIVSSSLGTFVTKNPETGLLESGCKMNADNVYFTFSNRWQVSAVNHGVVLDLHTDGTLWLKGVLNASLVYTSTVHITTSSYVVDPSTSPADTYIVDDAIINLPPASSYDGLELKFYFKPPTTRVPVSAKLFTPTAAEIVIMNSQNLYESINEYELPIGGYTKIKSMLGRWFVLL